MRSYKHFCCKLHLVLALVLGLVVAPLYLSLSLLSTPVSASTYTASLSTSGTVNLNVSASGNGANVTTDNLSIISTCPSGYNISISGPTDSTLYKDGNSSNTGATKKILASSGTAINPLPIIGSSGSTSYTKTWGYTTETLSGDSPVTTNSNFVGLTSTIATIATSNSPTTSQGTTLPISYGVSVDSTIEPGLYTMAESSQGANDNKITYYLTTSPSCTSYTVNFNPTSTAGGQTLTGTGTMNPQTIQEGVATNLNQNTYTAPSGYYFAGWNTAQNGTGTHYQNQQQVTDLTTAGSSITLYAEWTDCQPGKICYNDNGANSQTTMGNQTVSSSATNVTLWASNYQRSNYGFAGWNTKADGTGTNYGPNEDIDNSATLASIQERGLKLYAKWIQSQGNIQDWQGCSSMNEGNVTALKDTRDNQVYAIAKLADGKCWMIENLRLNTSGSNDQTKAQGFGGVFAGLANPETADFSSSTTANSLYYSGTQSGTATIDIGTANSVAYRFPRYNNRNAASPVSNMTSVGSNVYSYGNYYTWGAAMANTNYYTGATDETDGKTSETANTSICPSGWRLPYGRDTGNGATPGGFSYLDIQLGGTGTGSDSSTTPTGTEESKIWRKYPNNFIYAGYYSGSSVNSQGSYAFYWSNTSRFQTTGYYLQFNNTYLGPGNNNGYKYRGQPVRCLAGEMYKVAFNPTSTAGGQTLSGTGTMNNQTIDRSVATALNSNTYTAPTDYEFKEWNTAQDGTGTSYSDGQSVTNLTTAGQTITLYAQWKKVTLYDKVAAMSKGTQTAADLQATITKPTSSDPSTDTSNSGVYEYNSSVFGASSDASNDHKIYYYRGILDNNLDGTSSTYGSNGDGTLYPNYVRLGTANTATCWRIVRTTGSGGVKLLYNGAWNTTTNSCANATDGAQIRSTAAITAGDTSTFTSAFNGTSSTNRRIALVGYTYNPTYGDANVSTSTSANTVFGSNANYSGNSKNSTIKSNIETWYNNNLNNYTSILEPSAGYCNDRTAYSNDTTSTALTTIVPYSTSTTAMYFGAYGRNYNATNAGKTPSLTCPSSRNVVDLYTTSSATNGNKQLSKPVALLTADELSFAGSGRTPATQGSAYNDNSFARSGSYFWSLSSYGRYSSGYAYDFRLGPDGCLGNGYVNNASGVRPSISLKSGTTPTSGTGTAVDPWVVEPFSCNPSGTTISTIKCMQDINSTNKSSVLASMTEDQQYHLYDSRDLKQYYISKLKDGKIWMTQNLDLNLDSTKIYTHADTDLGWGSDTATTTWTPSNSTIDATNVTNNSISGWTQSYNNPYSVDPGNVYWTGTWYSSNSNVFMNNDFGSNPVKFQRNTPFSSNGAHGHVGNYYNWSAAVASNNTSSYSTNTYSNPSANPQNSICPAGWRLPTSSDQGNVANSTSEFARINGLYNQNSSSGSERDRALTQSPLYLVRGGLIQNGTQFYSGYEGYYWSSTVGNSATAYPFYLSSGYISINENYERDNGYSVRCVAR